MGQDDENNQDSQGTSFSEEQRQELIRMTNAANSAHHTRMQKVFDQKLADMQNSMTESFGALLQQQFEKMSSRGDKSDKNPGGDNGDERASEMEKQYSARMAEMEKKLERERQARIEEAERARIAKERSELQSALRSAGVPDERLRSAVALLYTEDKRVEAKDNSVVFKMQRDGYVDELELEKGISEWLSTPEGKHFAPPRDVRGSGAQGGSRNGAGNRNHKKSKQELKHDLMRAIIMSERG